MLVNDCKNSADLAFNSKKYKQWGWKGALNEFLISLFNFLKFGLSEDRKSS